MNSSSSHFDRDSFKQLVASYTKDAHLDEDFDASTVEHSIKEAIITDFEEQTEVMRRLNRIESTVADLHQLVFSICKCLNVPLVSSYNNVTSASGSEISATSPTQYNVRSCAHGDGQLVRINAHFHLFEEKLAALPDKMSFRDIALQYYKWVLIEYSNLSGRRGFLFTPKKPYAQSLTARAILFALRPSIFICERWPCPRRVFANPRDFNLFMCEYRDVIHSFFYFCLTGKITEEFAKPRTEEELKKPHQKKFMLKEWMHVLIF